MLRSPADKDLAREASMKSQKARAGEILDTIEEEGVMTQNTVKESLASNSVDHHQIKMKR